MIPTLLRDPARRERMGKAAREWARRYDADWIAMEFERIYTDLVQLKIENVSVFSIFNSPFSSLCMWSL